MMQDQKIWRDIEAVGEVLTARLPMLAMTLANPTPARCLEAERMVTEKTDAAVEGIFALQKYCFSALMNAWQVPLGNDHFQGAFDAYMEPGRKTLQANVERLREEADV